jgi:hypothetical protein
MNNTSVRLEPIRTCNTQKFDECHANLVVSEEVLLDIPAEANATGIWS